MAGILLIYVHESATPAQQKLAEERRGAGQSVQIRNGALFNGVEPGVEAVYAADFPGIATAYKEAGVRIADESTSTDDESFPADKPPHGKSAAAPAPARRPAK